jgi:two-component system cell cycle sensor histidine kinase/response regulator CckA
MMESQLAIGLVEDNPGDARLIQKMLGEPQAVPFRVDWLSRLDDTLDRVGREPFDVLLLDLGLPDSQGLATFDRVIQRAPMMPIIIFSGAIDEQLAVEAVARGAQDYLVKGHIDSVLLKRAIRYAIERKRTERALRDNEDRTSFALAAAEMGVWELEFATDRLSWSDTMAPVFGLTPARAPTRTEEFLQLIHPDDRNAVRASIGRAVAGENAYAMEFRTIWPDGSTHWASGLAKASNGPDGQPFGLVGVGIDISNRKSLEAQLRQSQKLEAIGQLAGGVAHDFNNLLTVVLGYSNMVIDTFDADDGRRSDLQEVINAGQRAVTLTRQLLAFSRKQVLQPIAVDLNALVTGIRQMLGRLIGEHISLVAVLAPELHIVQADPGQLEQIVMNLVVNARDAMPVGGQIAIETANIELDGSYDVQHDAVRGGSYVMLSVRDGGIGMNEETKRRLFEPFFTTKDPGKGTGLGLATVYGIVKQSGGYVRVRSEPGAGSTFMIYLPIAEKGEAVLAPATSDNVTAAGTETLLVVEDEEAIRLLARAILEKAGYRVFDASNAQQAEALFEENPTRFDLLVTDVIMPGLSGPKLFERLDRLRPGLKALYVSGYTDDAIVHQGQMAPGVQYLQKPFTADELNRRVREVLDR